MVTLRQSCLKSISPGIFSLNERARDMLSMVHENDPSLNPIISSLRLELDGVTSTDDRDGVLNESRSSVSCKKSFMRSRDTFAIPNTLVTHLEQYTEKASEPCTAAAPWNDRRCICKPSSEKTVMLENIFEARQKSIGPSKPAFML